MKKQRGTIAGILALMRWLDKFSWESLTGAGFSLWLLVLTWAAIETGRSRNASHATGSVSGNELLPALIALNALVIGAGLHAFAICRAIRNFVSRRRRSRDERSR